MKLFKNRQTYLLWGVLLFIFITTSCVNDIDFDQAEDFQATPELVGSIASFKYTANQLAMAPQPLQVTEDVEVKLFEEHSFFQENTQQATLFLEFTNTIPQNFEAEIQLLDNSNNVIDTFTFSIAAASNQPVTTSITKHYPLSEVPMLMSTTQLSLSFSGSVNTDDTGELQFKSAATLQLLIE